MLCNAYIVQFIMRIAEELQGSVVDKAAHGSVRLTFEHLQTEKFKSCLLLTNNVRNVIELLVFLQIISITFFSLGQKAS